MSVSSMRAPTFREVRLSVMKVGRPVGRRERRSPSLPEDMRAALAYRVVLAMSIALSCSGFKEGFA